MRSHIWCGSPTKLEKWMILKDFIITSCWLAQAIEAFEWLKNVREPSCLFWDEVISTLNCPDKFFIRVVQATAKTIERRYFLGGPQTYCRPQTTTMRYSYGMTSSAICWKKKKKLDSHVYMNQCLQHAHRSNFTSSRGKGNNNRLSLMWPICTSAVLPSV